MSHKRTTLELVLRIIILVVFYEIFVNINMIPLNTYYSNIYIAYVVLFTTIVSFKYLILRHQFERKTDLKQMIIVILGFFFISYLGIEFLYKHIETYNLETKFIINSPKTMASFLVFPMYAKEIQLNKLLIIDGIVSMVPIILEFFRRKKEDSKTSYLIERAEKFIFRYYWIFVFYIICSTLPSKITYIRNIKILGRYFLLLFAFLTILKYFFIYRELKTKKGKRENLIVLITPNNYDFSVSDHYMSPLRKFRKYDNKNFFKFLIVEGSNYVFATYEAVRYNFISLENYNNIVYVIGLNGNEAELVSTNTNFAKKVLNIIQNENYIIYGKKSSELGNYLNQKYNYRFINQLDVKKALDVIYSDKNMDIIKEKAFKTLKYIKLNELKNYIQLHKEKRAIQETTTKAIMEESEYENSVFYSYAFSENKNNYLNYGLNVILNSFNYVEIFYILLKMSEYQTHYMGLKNILLKENVDDQDKRDVKKGFLSTWRKYISIDHNYYIENGEKPISKSVSSLTENIEMLENLVTEKDLVQSINQIYAMDASKQYQEKTSYSFQEVCKVIADVRNGYVAHGSVSYEFAKKISPYLFNVYFSILEEFEAIEILIKEDEKIKQVLENELSAIYLEGNGLFLYSNTRVENSKDLYSEALNYESGNGRIIDKKVVFHIDNKYSDEDIKKGLGRKVIKGNES